MCLAKGMTSCLRVFLAIRSSSVFELSFAVHENNVQLMNHLRVRPAYCRSDSSLVVRFPLSALHTLCNYCRRIAIRRIATCVDAMFFLVANWSVRNMKVFFLEALLLHKGLPCPSHVHWTKKPALMFASSLELSPTFCNEMSPPSLVGCDILPLKSSSL